MASASQQVSIIIPHLNSESGLSDALDGIAAAAAVCRVSIEVIVVDNGSRVVPAEVVAAHPFAVLLREPTPGAGPARNTGAAAAKSPILAFLDADCVPEPGWLAAMVEAFSDPGTEIVGGDVRIRPRGDRLDPIEAYESVFGYRQALYISRDHYAATLNMAVRASVFARVGPFAGLGVAEDKDWGQRAHALGHAMRYLPNMRVSTAARSSFAELARKWDRHIADHFRERRSNVTWFAKAGLLALSPLAELPRIVGSDRIGPAAWPGAFATLTRLRLYRAWRMAQLVFGADPARLTRRWREG